MSAERRWDQRRFRIEESTTLNGGARTIFIEHMSPGTTVPPHYHTHFTETFDLIEGSMSIYSTTEPDIDQLEKSEQPVHIGVHSSVRPGIYHKYKVGDEPTTLRVILTPGYANFERLLTILNGLADDGELEKMGDSVVLMAVIMDLSDAHLIGASGEMLDGVRREKGEEVQALKEKLLQRYDTDEQLKALLR